MAAHGRGLGRQVLYVPLQIPRQTVQTTDSSSPVILITTNSAGLLNPEFKGESSSFTPIPSSNKGRVVTSGSALQPDRLLRALPRYHLGLTKLSLAADA